MAMNRMLGFSAACNPLAANANDSRIPIANVFFIASSLYSSRPGGTIAQKPPGGLPRDSLQFVRSRRHVQARGRKVAENGDGGQGAGSWGQRSGVGGQEVRGREVSICAGGNGILGTLGHLDVSCWGQGGRECSEGNWRLIGRVVERDGFLHLHFPAVQNVGRGAAAETVVWARFPGLVWAVTLYRSIGGGAEFLLAGG